MTFGDVLITLLVGGAVGWLASVVMKTDAQMGVVANVVVGILGSLIGAWGVDALDLSTGGTIARWAVAILGAIALIAALKLLKVYR